MGNNSSRGAYPPQYPPKHAYYSERRGHKPRKGGGGGFRYPNDADYEHQQRYPSHSRYPHYSAFQSQGYQPVPPPPLPFPNVATPSPYPVIPPVPPRHHYSASAPPVIPNPSYFQPNMHMPEPTSAGPPVYPHQHMPGGPVIPSMPQASMYPNPSASVSAPVIPPPSMSFPQAHMGGGMPQPTMSDGSSPPDNMHEGPPLAPGQYGPSVPYYERPESMKFNHNPLPTPPKDVFELSPYVGLLKDLHRPVEETLRRTATSPQYAAAYIVSPTGSQASREQKPRKGLFRSLSNRLAGRPKREPEPQRAYPAPIVLAAAPVIPAVIPGTGGSPVVPPPGAVWSAGPPTGFVPHGPASQPQPQAPPSPAPSHRSHHSRRSSRHSPRQMPLKIDLQNNFAGLTHLSPHRVHHDRKSYPSAFHLFEAMRFMGTRSDVSEQIRTCPSVDEVRAIVNHNSAFCRPDWEHVFLHMMEEVLYTKFIQHPHLRSLLLSTGDALLMYSDPHDELWGDGPLGRGANELGRALERVRDRLISEGFTIEET